MSQERKQRKQPDTDINNVALVGASGNLGPAVVEAFLKDGGFNVTAISRQESKATFPNGVKVIKADLTNTESITKAFEGQDAVILIVGASELAGQSQWP